MPPTAGASRCRAPRRPGCRRSPVEPAERRPARPPMPCARPSSLLCGGQPDSPLGHTALQFTQTCRGPVCKDQVGKSISYRETATTAGCSIRRRSRLCCDGSDGRYPAGHRGASAVPGNPEGGRSFTESGTLERLEVAGTSYCSSRRTRWRTVSVVSGCARVRRWVSIRSRFWTKCRNHANSGWSQRGRPGRNVRGDLTVTVALRLAEQRAAWFWHVTVTNRGSAPAEVDLVHVQDVALAPFGCGAQQRVLRQPVPRPHPGRRARARHRGRGPAEHARPDPLAVWSGAWGPPAAGPPT